MNTDSEMMFDIWPGIICVSSVIIGAQKIRGPARLIVYVERLSNVLFLMHAIERRHTGSDVIGATAIEHALARIDSQHVGRFHACRQAFATSVYWPLISRVWHANEAYAAESFSCCCS